MTKSLRPGDGPGRGDGDDATETVHTLFTTERRKPQANLNEPLRRLGMLRRALDQWDQSGAAGAMPQPSQFELDLPPLRPSQINWRAAR